MRWSVILFFGLLCITHGLCNKTVELDSAVTECEVGWHGFGDKCYRFHNDMLGATFHDSLTICHLSHEAQILTIHSNEEANFIEQMLFEKNEAHYSAWIGLVRINDSDFIWIDRSPLNFTKWASNEPNNWNSVNFCVVLSSDQANRGMWYDVPCNNHYLVICQKSKQLNNTDNVEFTSAAFNMMMERELFQFSIDRLQSHIVTLSHLVGLNFLLVLISLTSLLMVVVYRRFRENKRSRPSENEFETGSDKSSLCNSEPSSTSRRHYVPSGWQRAMRTVVRFLLFKWRLKHTVNTDLEAKYDSSSYRQSIDQCSMASTAI